MSDHVVTPASKECGHCGGALTAPSPGRIGCAKCGWSVKELAPEPAVERSERERALVDEGIRMFKADITPAALHNRRAEVFASVDRTHPARAETPDECPHCGGDAGEHVCGDAHYRDSAQPETVNHPAHYGGDTPYEVIKIIESWQLGFSLGNALKYIVRAGKKSSTTVAEDRAKAQWYLRRAQNLRERGGHLYVQAEPAGVWPPLDIDGALAAHGLSNALRPVLYGIQFGDIRDAIAAYEDCP